MKNRAAFLLENRKLEIRNTDMPKCGPDDLLIKIEYCGICGSDVHLYSFGEPAFPDIYPYILGHECSGVVVEAGSNVKTHQPGNRVTLEPGITCGKCEWCKSGKYNLCPEVRFLSAPRYPGAMQNFVVHPAELCFKLPEELSTLEGALIEPLSVGLNAVCKCGIHIGQTALILGAGCIGLTTLLSLKAAGVSKVIVADLYEVRLQKAEELGAAGTICATEKDIQEEVKKYFPDGPDFVFETAGSKNTTAQTVRFVKRGGTIVLIGNVVGETPFNFQLLVDKEVSIQTVFRYRNIYPQAIAAVAGGQINISTIVSNIYSLEEAPKAFEDCINKKQSMIKAVVCLKEDE